jgi:hypothetical protein
MSTAIIHIPQSTIMIPDAVAGPVPVPAPRVPMAVRAGTAADIPFMDGLQKKYGKALGHFATSWFEGHLAAGGVLIAESVLGPSSLVIGQDKGQTTHDKGQRAQPVGYIIYRDRYLRRDELGVVFQLCVAPGVQRGFIGAALLKAAFERSAYGCRLFCCWCAQDLEANYFWEAMGFVPLAFRAGSDRKKRVHIFWQKKIVGPPAPPAGAETKWWYPFQTTGGAIRADRLVFPIPEGTHWRDVRAVELPETETPKLEGPREKPARVARPAKATGLTPMGGFRFASEVAPAAAKTAKNAKAAKIAKPKAKIDARFLAAGRELRDRYLEHVNAGAMMLEAAGKYDVTRALPESPSQSAIRNPQSAIPLLPAA